ncbi:Uncharacterized protein PCOAH_00045610 [Plasmodium coatneyi]|uniref:Uncharacterized protein n=1 Tax=Plasmodium coatneyi TaxID=208452 RepID=A0A1B1E5G3_9APIC|nr:Uncharacterized protein PCOAH_00045610 [Plasmodium coatneyi]ANQ10272.1 Uncharacterized protein PCOAH_00045610 [Plasmodium coatneyi]
MAHSMGSPYSPYFVVDVDKPFSSITEKYYVSEPYNPPHTSVISGTSHGRFPSYYVDGEDYFYNGEEDFLMKEPEISQDPKPDENKTEEVENKAKIVESTNKGLTFFQAVMIIVFLMRWARNNSTRQLRKHEARKKLLRYLDKVNENIKKDDLKMERKLKRMEEKIKKEEEEMELKWKEKRRKIRDKIAKNPSKDTLPGIGPFYDKDKSLLDKKLDIVDSKYQKYKYNKKRRWNLMRAAYHEALEQLQYKQEARKVDRCIEMFLFEAKWNFGTKSFKKYMQQRQKQYYLDKVFIMKKRLQEKEKEKARIEAEKAEAARAAEEARKAEEAKRAEEARRVEAAKRAEAEKWARKAKFVEMVKASQRAQAAKTAIATAGEKAAIAAREKGRKEDDDEDDDDDLCYYFVNYDDEYYDDSDDYYDYHPSVHGHYDQDDYYS